MKRLAVTANTRVPETPLSPMNKMNQTLSNVGSAKSLMNPMSAQTSERMPAWEGPYKLMIKILSANILEKVAPKGTELYPTIEFVRQGTT